MLSRRGFVKLASGLLVAPGAAKLIDTDEAPDERRVFALDRSMPGTSGVDDHDLDALVRREALRYKKELEEALIYGEGIRVLHAAGMMSTGTALALLGGTP